MHSPCLIAGHMVSHTVYNSILKVCPYHAIPVPLHAACRMAYSPSFIIREMHQEIYRLYLSFMVNGMIAKENSPRKGCHFSHCCNTDTKAGINCFFLETRFFSSNFFCVLGSLNAVLTSSLARSPKHKSSVFS